jgi:hypothetical protein
LSLIESLIQIGALHDDAVITARSSTYGKFGIIKTQEIDYNLLDITADDRGVVLNLGSKHDGVHTTASCADVTAIDGMSVERYAELYNINSDGTLKAVGRKRGRKPKNR